MVSAYPQQIRAMERVISVWKYSSKVRGKVQGDAALLITEFSILNPPSGSCNIKIVSFSSGRFSQQHLCNCKTSYLGQQKCLSITLRLSFLNVHESTKEQYKQVVITCFFLLLAPFCVVILSYQKRDLDAFNKEDKYNSGFH